MWRLSALVLLFAPPAFAADCADRCSAKQDRCVTSCDGLAKCTRRCIANGSACHSACQGDGATREQRDAQAALENCVTEDGTPRRCSESEKKALREVMAKASALFCKDKSGELVPCADQEKKVARAARELARQCKKNKELCVDEQAGEAEPESEQDER